MNKKLLDVDKLSLVVDGKTLLHNISFSLEERDILHLSGSSGSGKSLLLKSILGFFPTTVSSLKFFGNPSSTYKIEYLRANAIYIPQKAQFFGPSVLDEIRRPFLYKINSNKKFNSNKLKDLLTYFERDESFLDKPASVLSGGEEQLIAIMRAYLLEPKILFLDESFSAIDGKQTEKLKLLLNKWVSETYNRGIILTVHRQELSPLNVTKTIFMDSISTSSL
ncbi:MAG: ATP-binding cassette domain-containing protein [Leptospiraceae bacterium]|nr:ATP-binding cassette domain-containing protein [Leptospiraceae bacterium]MCP5497691.1 ATP-binding cassette domain-containing protein [Leptospiraceae bacterium]